MQGVDVGFGVDGDGPSSRSWMLRNRVYIRFRDSQLAQTYQMRFDERGESLRTSSGDGRTKTHMCTRFRDSQLAQTFLWRFCREGGGGGVGEGGGGVRISSRDGRTETPVLSRFRDGQVVQASSRFSSVARVHDEEYFDMVEGR